MTDPDGLAKFFMASDRKAEELPPSYNVAPTDPVYAVTEYHDERLLVVFRWGLVPNWSKSPVDAAKSINARAETVASRPAFRRAFERRRCLIPADGFYEWKKRGSERIPYYLHSRGGTPLAFAGLWEFWRDPDDPGADPLRTCSVITTDASAPLRWLHDRMPVILPAQHWDTWLDREFRDTEALRGMLAPAPADALAFHEVSKEANSPRNNHPGLLVPVDNSLT